MSRRITTSYEIVTPESAADGDSAENGWEDKKGETFDDVDEAISWLRRKGAIHPSNSHFSKGTWYSTDEDMNVRTGAWTTYAFHLSGFSVEEQRTIFNAIRGRSNPVKKKRKSKRVARRGGRVMTVTTSSRVVKTTRMNPKGVGRTSYRGHTIRVTYLRGMLGGAWDAEILKGTHHVHAVGSAKSRADAYKRARAYIDGDRSNPRIPRNVTETEHRVGDVVVTIERWRLPSATACIFVTAHGPHGSKRWEAKSQGPSSGGYNKGVQAASRVMFKISGEWGSEGSENLDEIARAAAVAVRNRSNPSPEFHHYAGQRFTAKRLDAELDRFNKDNGLTKATGQFTLARAYGGTAVHWTYPDTSERDISGYTTPEKAYRAWMLSRERHAKMYRKNDATNPSFGSSQGFNIAVARLKSGVILFMTKSGLWKPIAQVGRFKPALYNGGIPNTHYERLKRIHSDVAQFGAEPWPEMPNINRARSNPHDPRTASTQRLPVIRVMIPASTGKDPRRAETQRLKVVRSKNNPGCALRISKSTWRRLPKVDRKGRCFVRCKMSKRGATRWVRCVVR